MPELLATIHDVRVPGVERTAHARRARRDQAAPRPRPHARRGRVPQPATACAPCRATTPTTRSGWTSTGQSYEVHYLPAESDSGMFGGQLELAGTGLVPSQLPHPARPAAPLRVLRRRLQGGVPDRLGPRVHAVRGRGRARTAAGVDLPAGRERAATRCAAARRSSRPTRTGTTCCCSTSTSTATTVPGVGASHQTGWTGLVARIIQVTQLPAIRGPAADRAPRQPRLPREILSGCRSRVSPFVVRMRPAVSWP